MNTFLLSITSPDGHLLHEKVYRLSLRGAEGDLAIMAGHIPFMTTVQKGEVRIIRADESVLTGTAEGGILTVTETETVLLSSGFCWDT
ncbi:MAG: hypothetical protein J6X30_01120 [Clostridia bacterium]|nr:hypothetical protein [Clostridia bacterium]